MHHIDTHIGGSSSSARPPPAQGIAVPPPQLVPSSSVSPTPMMQAKRGRGRPRLPPAGEREANVLNPEFGSCNESIEQAKK